MATEFRAGDLLWFRQDVRGGYGYDRDVPALFVGEGPHRITIRLLLKNGDRKVVHVKGDRLRSRERTTL